jgi:uncharacterized membrane protein YfcA
VSALPETLILLTAVFLLAGLVKGVIGMGLPLVAIGLLSLAMTPAQAIAMTIIPGLITNIWQFSVGPSMPATIRRLWPMLVGTALGIWAGATAGALDAENARYASIALGFVIMLYVLTGLLKPPPPTPPAIDRWLSPMIGLVTGIVASPTGILVLPGVAYLQAQFSDRNALIQALGLYFTVATVALGLVAAQAGVLNADNAWLSAFAVIPAFAGMAFGARLRGVISQRAFRMTFLIGLFVVGARLASRVVG